MHCLTMFIYKNALLPTPKLLAFVYIYTYFCLIVQFTIKRYYSIYEQPNQYYIVDEYAVLGFVFVP